MSAQKVQTSEYMFYYLEGQTLRTAMVVASGELSEIVDRGRLLDLAL
jgi:hypothetical protein